MSSQEDFVDLDQEEIEDKSQVDYDFLSLSQEEYEKYNKNDQGKYEMLKNISCILSYICDLRCNKDKELFDLWPERVDEIKKRIDIVNKSLDVYDLIYPYTIRKPIFTQKDLKNIHEFMDRLLYDVRYTWMDGVGVDVNLEIGSPGWLELKKVLLRFFSKIKIAKKFKLYDEEVEGTGHIRPIRRNNNKLRYIFKISEKDGIKDKLITLGELLN